MPRLRQLFLAVAIALGSGAALAADVIDQNSPVHDVNMSTFQVGFIGQSFQQSASNISGAGVFLDPSTGTTDTVTISLWDKFPTESSATNLATASGTGTAGSWLDVFWSPVSVTPNTTYYLTFSGNTTLAIAGDQSAGYSRGNLITWSPFFPGFAEYPNYDYSFRTYASVSAVPEPETYAMMLAGLGVLGFIGKRRRAN